MRELPGIALIALGCGLLISGVMMRRCRPERSGRSSPPWARSFGR